RQDELNIKLAPRLRELAVQGQELLRSGTGEAVPPSKPKPPSGAAVVWSGSLAARGGDEVRRVLRGKVEELEAALRDAGDDVELEGEIRLVEKEGR
ncbi:MAG: hypothetical protein ACOC9O_03820, partial [Myxococcota bacterium]